MRRRSFLSPYKFLVIVLYTFNLLAEWNDVVRGECPPLSQKGPVKLPRIVGYYIPDNSSRLTNYTGDSTILTHLNYVVPDPNDLLKPNFADNNLLEIKNNKNSTKCKVLLSVSLSKIDPITPWDISFANILAGHINNYALDGVDIEYPFLRCNSLHNENTAFPTFISLLRVTLGSSKNLTITYGPHHQKLDPNIINNNNIDFVNVMAYQLNYDNVTVILSSPLNHGTQTYGYDNYFSYLGISGSDKVVIGVDFGGVLEMVSLVINDFVSNFQNGSLARSQFNAGPPIGARPLYDNNCSLQNRRAFSLSLRDMIKFGALSSNLCAGSNSWTRIFDSITQEPYLYKLNDSISNNTYQFISYEDPESLSQKIYWIVTNKYGGLAIANLTGDTDNNMMLSVIKNIVDGLPTTILPPTSTISTPGTTDSSASSNSPASNHSNNLSAGAISGIVIVVVLSFVALSAFMIIFVRKRRQNNEKGVNWPNRPVAPNTTMLATAQPTFVTALYDFEGKEESDLSFKKGDRIEVIERGNGPIDWWVGKVNGVVGEFPGNYIVMDS